MITRTAFRQKIIDDVKEELNNDYNRIITYIPSIKSGAIRDKEIIKRVAKSLDYILEDFKDIFKSKTIEDAFDYATKSSSHYNLDTLLALNDICPNNHYVRSLSKDCMTVSPLGKNIHKDDTDTFYQWICNNF